MRRRPARRRDDAILVTDAARSRVEERDERRRRYLWSMAVRTICFILAVVLFDSWERWVALAASLVLPWVAVVFANAGPVRETQAPAFFTDGPDRGIEAPREQPPRG